jgi:very-short-patch-repair endonuclease
VSRLSPIEKIARDVAEKASDWVYELEEEAKGDSPIEKLLWMALVGSQHTWAEFELHTLDKRPSEETYKKYKENYGDQRRGLFAFIVPQFQIDRYRIDFAIFVRDCHMKEYCLLVECDGHDFHERTKEQASRDRSRDRTLQSLGYKIFRFTGSDIYRDPMKCAEDIVSQLSRWAYF